MNRREALHNFWSSFGVEAYEQNQVPMDSKGEPQVSFPYITYESKVAGWDEPLTLSVTIWDDTGNRRRLDRISRTIEDFIRPELNVSYDRGMYRIWIGNTPFSQDDGDPDPKILKTILTINIEFMDILKGD